MGVMVHLTDEAMEQLLRAADEDLRPVPMQAAYMLEQALAARARRSERRDARRELEAVNA